MLRAFSRVFFIFSFLCSLAFAEESLPAPYSDLQELLPYSEQGWFLNAVELEALIKKRQVKTAIEIGCWLGSSTRFIASQLPEGGKLYAVDHWLGSPENQVGEWAYTPALPVLYEQFLSNVIHMGLTQKITPIRMYSLDAAVYLRSTVAPDLIYIDAGHDTPSVYADLLAWYPYVQEKGIICGDDWIWDTVQAAVKRFAKEQGLSIEASGNFWSLVK